MSVQLFIDADQTPVNQRSSVYTWDDFHAVGGDLNWDLAGTGAVVSDAGSGADHPGTTNLTTGATANNDATLSLTGFVESIVQTGESVFSPGQSTSVIYRVGFLSGFVTPSAGVCIEYDTSQSDTALGLCKYVSGTRTVIATLALTAGHWYRMGWNRTGSGTGTLTLNNLTAATSQSASVTGLGAGIAWKAGFYVQTLTAQSRAMQLDWFLAAMTGMNR